MLRPPDNMSDLMRIVARYIELEEYFVGPGSEEITDASKCAGKDAKKQVNTVAQKEGNGSGTDRGDRPPRHG